MLKFVYKKITYFKHMRKKGSNKNKRETIF